VAYSEFLIASVTVGSGGASSINFSSIPATYTDLYIKISARASAAYNTDAEDLVFKLNTTSTITSKVVRGDGTAAASNSITDRILRAIVPSDWTANTFSNVEIYIPNYAGSNNKSWSADHVLENNATLTGQALTAGLTSITAAITDITLTVTNGYNFVQYTTAYLYGIKNS
jgi:hypothetical protein